MKRSSYLLQIDNPCPASWEGMHPTATGRFCDSCAKNVVDFTALTDAQILNASSYCLPTTGGYLNGWYGGRGKRGY